MTPIASAKLCALYLARTLGLTCSYDVSVMGGCDIHLAARAIAALERYHYLRRDHPLPPPSRAWTWAPTT